MRRALLMSLSLWLVACAEDERKPSQTPIDTTPQADMTSDQASTPDQDPSGQALELEVGQRRLTSLDEDCEGVQGLNGAAILKHKLEASTHQLRYISVINDEVVYSEPVELTLSVSWPQQPTLMCYPAYQDERGRALAPARLAMLGLTLRVKTPDGRLDETMAARAQLSDAGNGSFLAIAIQGTLPKERLRGAYDPSADYGPRFQSQQLWGYTFATQAANGTASGVTLGAMDAEAIRRYITGLPAQGVALATGL